MQIFGNLFQEIEDRSAIFIRYDGDSLLEKWRDYLNTDTHRCIIIKKNASAFVFIVYSSQVKLEMSTIFDYERSCFKVQECKSLNSLENASIEIDKIQHVDRYFELAIKPKEWKYRNFKSIEASHYLHDEIVTFDSYDVVMEELRRQEEIRLRKEKEEENARKQLEVWKKYLKKERELIERANKPFALESSLPDIKKSLVDIETRLQITSTADSETLEFIADIIGGTVDGDKLVMTLEEFEKWQESEEKAIDVKLSGKITLKVNARCESHWDAKKFKEDHKYGREFFFESYDYETYSIPLTYWSTEINEILEFFNRVNDSSRFSGIIPKSKAKISFGLKVTVTESEDERKKRIDILSGRDLYSGRNMTGVYLGRLIKKGSDRRHLRIKLPEKEEERHAAKEFFKEGDTLIYPDLLKDKILLKRESNALEKLDTPHKLQNPLLKEFIFNSSRAQATAEFVGLSSEDISKTPQYLDCARTQMLLLNPSQQEAVVKGLYAKDLCLLQGPPGTGKTTVISELIWQHIRKNQQIRMMLTSQTNLAIDNALNRLFSNSAVKEGSSAWRNMMLIKPIRKADSEKIEEEGQPFTKERIDDWIAGKDEEKSSNNIVCRWMNHIAQRVEEKDFYEDILSEWKSSLNNPSLSMREIFAHQYLQDSNVLCMTCGKVDSKDFNDYEKGEGFDVVIVDEASKATLPELLMPLCYARKSIIIGDHRQLPPVIFEETFFKKIREIDPDLEAELDKQFKHEIVNESLFKRLIMHPYLSPSIKATFNVQYRMHPDINAVISQFYAEDSGGLSCGLNMAKVDAPDFSEKDSRYHGLSFGKFIQPNVHTIWVDVPDGMEQGGEGSSSFNEKEIEAVELVVEALVRADGFNRYMSYWDGCRNAEARITESRIGVISFYADQVRKISNRIQPICDKNNVKVATKSVDRFQGQESGIVIVSTVRTKKLGFTRTPERLNVALSRARRLLIIVGNSTFYSSEEAKTDEGKYIYKNVIERIKNNNNNDVFIDYRELKNLLGY